MAAPKGIRAGDGIVLRTPLLPLSELPAWASGGDEAAARRYLLEVTARPEVNEAIFVASPSLHAALDGWRAAPTSAAGQRVEPAVAKYVARMMGRATPFGLFSAVSAGRLGPRTELALGPRAEYRRRTRLDNDYLFLLLDELGRDPAVRERLRYRPNTSIYRSAGRLRYASAQLRGTERSYHLVAAEPTAYLDATLARAAGGALLAELAAALVDDEIGLDEARAYVEQLVDGQLLSPDLGVSVTGPEPIDGVLAQLGGMGLEPVNSVLTDARTRLAELDRRVGNAVVAYTDVSDRLGALPAKVELGRLFQVDMVKPAHAQVSTRIAAEIATVVSQLARLARPADDLDEWKRQFLQRWESQLVPLAEALDEESGIGFETARGPGAEGAPLLADLPFAGATSDVRVRWSSYERHLMRRLGRALAAGDDEIVLGDDDLTAMQAPSPATLPDAFSAMFRLAGTPEELAAGNGRILFENATGPSGAKLLGRFCHASSEIEAMVRAHHALEEAHRPDAVYAEIAHLNEGRIGNILCRPVLRQHELVYLGVSGAPLDRQSTIEDLLVGVRGGRVVLWSRRLDREVLPRLTTAHNFRLRSLCVYRFLCALAGQGTTGVAFGWGPLASSPYLPRVRVGRVVVARATWNLDEAELAPITSAVRAAAKRDGPRDGVRAAVAALREVRRLPRWLVIAQGDNELPIDLDNPILVDAFADELAGAAGVTLTEMFPSPDELAVTGPEGGYANEIILTFTQPPRPLAPVPAIARPLRVSAPEGPRVFAPGSEWLYAKIYCGEATADHVLRDAVAPVVRSAAASGALDRWFFLRYGDPDWHVRVRFHGEPSRLLGEVLPALHDAIAPLRAEGAVRSFAIDTYVREIERYGGPGGIELIEEIFWRDSEAVLGIVELLDGDEGGVVRWKLAVRGIDALLDALGLSDAERAKVSTDGRESLGREFGAGSPLWSKIGERS